MVVIGEGSGLQAWSLFPNSPIPLKLRNMPYNSTKGILEMLSGIFLN